MIDLRSDDDRNDKALGWSEWQPARAATCRKGGCPTPAATDSEWCDKHLADVIAQRVFVNAGRLPDRGTRSGS